MGMGRRRVRGHQIKEPRVPGRACLALSRRRSRPGATRRGKRITPTARRDPGRGAWLLDEEGAVALTGGLARARVAHSAEAARAERSRAEWNRDRSSRGRRREEGRWRVGPGCQRGGDGSVTRGDGLSAGSRHGCWQVGSASGGGSGRRSAGGAADKRARRVSRGRAPRAGGPGRGAGRSETGRRALAALSARRWAERGKGRDARPTGRDRAAGERGIGPRGGKGAGRVGLSAWRGRGAAGWASSWVGLLWTGFQVWGFGPGCKGLGWAHRVWVSF